MRDDWAVEHLAVIRTLMERTAVYRRALVPTSFWAGFVGLAGGLAGWGGGIEAVGAFLLYWTLLGVLSRGGALVLMRREALRDSEPFWSPAARRVTAAMAPCLVAGFVAGLAWAWADRNMSGAAVTVRVSGVWMAFYGCALHAAGFFMPRGIRWFGWLFVVSAAGTWLVGGWEPAGMEGGLAHVLMAVVFGVLHLAYGGYLVMTRGRLEAP